MNTSLTRRNAVLGVLLAGAMGRLAAQAPARIFVGFPAGGSVDITARRIADSWRQRKGEAFTIDNRSGAGGQLAVLALKASAPDGSALLMTPASIMTIYPHVYRKIQYDAARDVVPVTSVCNFTVGFAIGPMVPGEVQTLAQYLAWAKANPQQAAYASPAAGAGPHFVGTLLAKSSGLPLLHVPYRGATPGLQDLLGGQIASGMFVLGDYLPHLASGKLRLLAVSSTERSRFAPQVPTFAELGHREVSSVESYGLFLPAGASAQVVDRIHDLASNALQDPAVIEGMARIGFEPALSTRGAYPAQLSRERARWAQVVKESGFSIDE